MPATVEGRLVKEAAEAGELGDVLVHTIHTRRYGNTDHRPLEGGRSCIQGCLNPVCGGAFAEGATRLTPAAAPTVSSFEPATITAAPEGGTGT